MDYRQTNRRIVAVQIRSTWSHSKLWRFVGDRNHHGRLVARRADAKHFPDRITAFRYVEFLFTDNPNILAWRIQTLDGKTVEQATRAEWENELA
jgi:hypothetical protein